MRALRPCWRSWSTVKPNASLSSRHLWPGSIVPLAPALGEGWIPGTSPGMTIASASLGSTRAVLLFHDLTGVDLDEVHVGHVLRALLAGGALLDEGDVAVDALHLDAPERLG